MKSNNLKNTKKEVKSKVTLEGLAIIMKKGFDRVDQRFEKMDERFEQIDKRLEKIDKRLESLENRISHVEASLLDLTRRFEIMDERQVKIEDKIDNQSQDINLLFRELDKIKNDLNKKRDNDKISEIESLVKRVEILEMQLNLQLQNKK